MHRQRIAAIFEKDMKDFMKNMMLLMMPIIPIVLSLLYSQIGGGGKLPLFMSYLIVGITFSTVTTSCIMTMMAEENEKKTLRGLIQSPASFLDILIGKSLVTGLMTLVSLILSLVIIGIGPFLNIRTVIGLILLFLFFLFAGIAIGLFVNSVAATSPYIMPVMFLFGFTPMVQFLFSKDSFVNRIANAFPIQQLSKIHHTDSWLPMVIMAIWVLGAALLTYICFTKTRRDDSSD